MWACHKVPHQRCRLVQQLPFTLWWQRNMRQELIACFSGQQVPVGFGNMLQNLSIHAVECSTSTL